MSFTIESKDAEEGICFQKNLLKMEIPCKKMKAK